MPSNRKIISLDYKPRFHQDLIHRSLKRFNVLVCHRRFGKTVLVLNEMVLRGLQNVLRNPQYAYLAPNYGQAKRVAWEFLKDIVRNIPGSRANEAELRIDIPRPQFGDHVRYMLLGAENPGSLRGIYLDGCIPDEFAECDPTIWGQVIRPALTDRLGWAIFIGTPKGRNHFWDVYSRAMLLEKEENSEWYTAIFKASETGIIPFSELEAARATMSEEEYAQEFECSFSAALIGAYYGKYMDEARKEGRICSVPYEPNALVHTYWDLGIRDTTVIWFMQQVGQEYHFIDYVEQSGEGIDYYVKELKKRPYNYGDHMLPHDGACKELGTGKSRQEVFRNLGVRTSILPRHSFEDGVNAVRMLLSKCYWDEKKCERGLNALINYERKWDAKNKIFTASAKHNWASHGADAFRTFGMGMRPDSGRRANKRLPREAAFDYSVFGG